MNVHMYIGKNQASILERLLFSLREFDAPAYYDRYSKTHLTHITEVTTDIGRAVEFAAEDSEKVRKNHTHKDDMSFRDSLCILAIPYFEYEIDKSMPFTRISGALSKPVYAEDIAVVYAHEVDNLDRFDPERADEIRAKLGKARDSLDQKYGIPKPLNWYKAKDRFMSRLPQRGEFKTNREINEQKWNSYVAIAKRLGLDR